MTISLPHVQIIPLQAAIPIQQASQLDVLVRVIPPASAIPPELLSIDSGPGDRRLNLSLVIDRSSSMASKQRLSFAKAAARHIIQQLSPNDRISVVTFDRHAQVLVPSTFVDDPGSIIQTVQGIEVGKWTNLHGGWVEGGEQVNRHIYPNTVNRVILLTDGWASTGVMNRATITAHVQEMAQVGISTTAVGVGDRYNEDLLEAIATQGDGNYYYINAPNQLPNAFDREMQALVATVGQQVTLDIQPQGDIEIADVLNDLQVTRQGRFKLPNMVSGFTFGAVVRFYIPRLDMEYLEDYGGGRDRAIARICRFRLHWSPPGSHGEMMSLKTTLVLPLIPAEHLGDYPYHPDVQQQAALMVAARLKRKAMALADRKEYESAQACLQEAKALVLDAPQSQWLELELVALESLEGDLRSRQLRQFRKRSHNESYQASTGFDQQSGIFGYGGDRPSP